MLKIALTLIVALISVYWVEEKARRNLKIDAFGMANTAISRLTHHSIGPAQKGAQAGEFQRENLLSNV